MSDYLARLKVIEKEKIFCNTPERELTKLTEVPFGGFVSSITGEIEKKNINFSDLKREERRAKVLQMLAENPDSQRAITTDTEADSNNVIITMAIRGVASFEMTIPREKYDAFLLLELIEKAQIQ